MAGGGSRIASAEQRLMAHCRVGHAAVQQARQAADSRLHGARRQRLECQPESSHLSIRNCGGRWGTMRP